LAATGAIAIAIHDGPTTASAATTTENVTIRIVDCHRGAY
jgi:hypothetical protein